MKKSNDIIIIGGGITGLYAGIKCLELGFNVKIIEKKYNFGNVSYNTNDISCELFNNNHSSYLGLLHKFNMIITPILNNNIRDNKILNSILDKFKNIPQNILLSFTFINLCKQLLTNCEYDELCKDSNENDILNTITAYDAVNIFKNDINNNVQYYKCEESYQELINKMVNYFLFKKGKLINNTEVTGFTYINKKFVIYCNYATFTSDILILSISKDNLLSFKMWNKEQIKSLNSVNYTSSDNLKNIYKFSYWYDNIIKDTPEKNLLYDKNIRDNLLTDLHIIYPIIKKKYKKIYFWNKNVNNIIMREKIRNIYNSNLFICGDSYCKNSIFINYSLETFDNIVPKLINKLL
jgi:protoporphyrinogen oxidase